MATKHKKKLLMEIPSGACPKTDDELVDLWMSSPYHALVSAVPEVLTDYWKKDCGWSCKPRRQKWQDLLLHPRVAACIHGDIVINPCAPIYEARVQGGRSQTALHVEVTTPSGDKEKIAVAAWPGTMVKVFPLGPHYAHTEQTLPTEPVLGVTTHDGIVKPLNPFNPIPIQVDKRQVRDLGPEKVVKIRLEDVGQDWEGVYAKGVIQSVEGELRDRDVGLRLATEMFDVPYEFSQATLDEADATPQVVRAQDRRGREDWRDVPLVTIDGDDSRDFDDAVWAQKHRDGSFTLRVAIADVSHYVKPCMAMEKDAQTRLTSVYFPTSVIPMLPRPLSEGICSLNPHVERLALAVEVHLAHDGTVIDYTFKKVVMKSAARLTYKRVEPGCTGEASWESICPQAASSLAALNELRQQLEIKRDLRAALKFFNKETQVIFDEQGGIVDFKPRGEMMSYRLIEEMMLVANVCAADWVEKHNKTALFRVHDEPSPEKIEKLMPLLKHYGVKLNGLSLDSPQAINQVVESVKHIPVLQTEILRLMARAEYQPENIGHYGLQYGAYAHFTSPIRRYPDLLLHRVIKAGLARRTYHPECVAECSALTNTFHGDKLLKGREAQDLSAWETLGLWSSSAERRADDASRFVMQRMILEWMSGQKRRLFEVQVIRCTKGGLAVGCVDYPIEGFVAWSNMDGYDYWQVDEEGLSTVGMDTGRRFEVGQTLLVQIESIDWLKLNVAFRVAREREARKEKGRTRKQESSSQSESIREVRKAKQEREAQSTTQPWKSESTSHRTRRRDGYSRLPQAEREALRDDDDELIASFLAERPLKKKTHASWVDDEWTSTPPRKVKCEKAKKRNVKKAKSKKEKARKRR